MKQLSDATLALFFTTQGASLQRWESIGILEREIKLYQHLAAHCKKIYLFTYGNRYEKTYSRLFPANVEIVYRPRYLPVMLYSFLLPFIQWKKLRTVTIAKTNQMDGSWAAVLVKKLFGAKLIVRCGYEWLFTLEQQKKSFLKRQFAAWAERFAYRNADSIVMTSESAISFARHRFGIPQNKFTTIPNYIDTTLFTPSEKEKEKGRVIYVGRLEKEKHIDLLINAMEGIDAHLVIIGKGNEEAALSKRAQEKGVQVTFKGTVPQLLLATELQKSEVFILPSFYEGNPKALLEAMACGLACIGTDVPGIQEVIKNNVNGVLCEPTVSALSPSLKKLLRDAEIRKELGENARSVIQQKYSFEKILEAELSVYTAL